MPVRVATGLASPSDSGHSAAVGDVLVFPASDGEPWRSDGTPAGTYRLMDIYPGAQPSGAFGFVAAGGFVFFVAFEPSGWGLWRTDGTTTGTTRLVDGFPTTLYAAGEHAYFSLHESLEAGFVLWRSDGSVSGTTRIKAGFSQSADEFASVSGTVYFRGTDAAHGQELWRTDGTESGTVLVDDAAPGPESSTIGGLRAVGSRLVFVAPGTERTTLYAYDGTGPTAAVLRASLVATSQRLGPVVANVLYFDGQELGAGAFELWRTDGTPAGTYIVKGAAEDFRGTMDFVAHGSRIYFTAIGNSGFSLWRTDGTLADTVKVFGTPPFTPQTLATGMGGVRDRFYFKAVDPATLLDNVWLTDGTLAGTRSIAALAPDAAIARWGVTTQGVFFFASHGDGTFDLDFLASDHPLADADGDGIPNIVETAEGRDLLAKDNDVFGSARLFAMQQYRDFLGREGDSAGVNNWSAQVAAGAMTRAQVLEAFFDSQEFQSGLPQVTRLYLSFFNRIPDYPGLLFHTGRFRAGVPLNTIAQDFAGSQEFLLTYGALSNGAFVDLVYQNVLGRPADPAGRANALAQLDGGALTRGELMVAFSESQEHLNHTASEVFVTTSYVGMLRRSPDPPGLQNWVNAFGGGLPRLGMLEAFLNSQEYHNRFLAP